MNDVAVCHASAPISICGRHPVLIAAVVGLILSCATTSDAQTAGPATTPATKSGAQQAATVSCASKPGERSSCPADTSRGVVLLRSTGEAPCLLGKTWGYDQTSVWVSDGCSAEFATGAGRGREADQAQDPHAHSERRLPARRRRKGSGLFPAVQLRAVSEPAESRRDLRGRLRQHEGRFSGARTSSCRSSSRRSRGGSSRRRCATTSTSGRRTLRRAIRRRSWARAI